MIHEYIIGAVVLIFNAGGFVYLAKNHFAHVNKSLDRIDRRLGVLEQRCARIEGALQLPSSLTEN